MVLPVTTWAAYNGWGGRSLYDGGGFNGLPRADVVSFDRPMQPVGSPIWEALQGHPFFTWEYPLVRWLEREGFDVGYVSSLDVHAGRLPTSGVVVSRRARRVLEHGHARHARPLVGCRGEPARGPGPTACAGTCASRRATSATTAP